MTDGPKLPFGRYIFERKVPYQQTKPPSTTRSTPVQKEAA